MIVGDNIEGTMHQVCDYEECRKPIDPTDDGTGYCSKCMEVIVGCITDYYPKRCSSLFKCWPSIKEDEVREIEDSLSSL